MSVKIPLRGNNGGNPMNNKQQQAPTPPGIPIDNLWAIILKWAGWLRTFEDGSQVVQVLLRKAELDRVARICYSIKVTPSGSIPIDNLWAIILKWSGWIRTFEDGLQVVQVILRKSELDRVVKACYGLEAKKP